MTQDKVHSVAQDKVNLALLAGLGAGGATLAAASGAHAAVPADVTTAVTNVEDTAGALGGLALGILAVVLTVIGIRMAIRYGSIIMRGV